MEPTTPQCNAQLHSGGSAIDERAEKHRRRRFERQALPHLDDVHSFARFLLRNPTDAEDAVQETFLAALKYFDSFRGGSMKAWLFAILRNVCYAETGRRKRRETPIDITEHADVIKQALWHMTPEPPDVALERQQTETTVHAMLKRLPAPLRETVIQRAFNDLSYKDVANASGAPIGTVMSRLSRARALLREMAQGRAA